MSSLVRSLGYKVSVFSSAEAFLDSPRLHDSKCLILDVQMPGMSGLDLQDELRARKYLVPIIFITAFPEERVRRRAEAGGAMGFFRKDRWTDRASSAASTRFCRITELPGAHASDAVSRQHTAGIPS
jgi:FixJ family two-component response regulator